MSSVVSFIAGLWIGSLVGVYTIALVQINRLEEDEHEPNETTKKPR